MILTLSTVSLNLTLRVLGEKWAMTKWIRLRKFSDNEWVLGGNVTFLHVRWFKVIIIIFAYPRRIHFKVITKKELKKKKKTESFQELMPRYRISPLLSRNRTSGFSKFRLGKFPDHRNEGANSGLWLSHLYGSRKDRGKGLYWGENVLLRTLAGHIRNVDTWETSQKLNRERPLSDLEAVHLNPIHRKLGSLFPI